MFGKKQPVLETVIGTDSTLMGTLSTKGTVRIDGTLVGTIEADWVIVGASGSVQGDVSARGLVAGGTLEGVIRASEIVEIKPGGHVVGDIYAPKMSIAEGGFFDGRSFMQMVREEGGKVCLTPVPRTAGLESAESV
jgi:cytoskeletal protein CcmA (bactofilin family)